MASAPLVITFPNMATTIHRFITNPAYHDYLAVLKGARNALVYGAKVRFLHALVLCIFLGNGSLKHRAQNIFKATRLHATQLAKFVALYKAFMLIQKKAKCGNLLGIDTFIAGSLGGYLALGKRDAISEQIVLYAVSRVIASFIPRAYTSSNTSGQASLTGSTVKPIPPDSRYFTLFAAATLGVLMWRFQNHAETLQPSMYYSMKHIYVDSDIWNDLKSLIWDC